MTTERSVRVTAAIVRQAGKILLARRPAGAHLAGCWEFPGGKIEEGETPEQCLARELQEEFAVQADVGQFVASSHFQYDSMKIELLAYEAGFPSGAIARRLVG
jgi:8-oxo-dGTP diphosphatase